MWKICWEHLDPMLITHTMSLKTVTNYKSVDHPINFFDKSNPIVLTLHILCFKTVFLSGQTDLPHLHYVPKRLALMTIHKTGTITLFVILIKNQELPKNTTNTALQRVDVLFD